MLAMSTGYLARLFESSIRYEYRRHEGMRNVDQGLLSLEVVGKVKRNKGFAVRKVKGSIKLFC